MCGLWVTDPLCDDLLFLIAGADSKQLNKASIIHYHRLHTSCSCMIVMFQSRTDVYVSHTPAGTSTQNIVHFGQGINSDIFQMYDWTVFDKNGNLNRYNQVFVEYSKDNVSECLLKKLLQIEKNLQATPPLYDVTKCSIPTYLYKGDLDILADAKGYIVFLAFTNFFYVYKCLTEIRNFLIIRVNDCSY